MVKKRKHTTKVRMSLEQSEYYGVMHNAAADSPKASFEQIFKKVFPHGMPAHPKPTALKAKYRRAFELAR